MSQFLKRIEMEMRHRKRSRAQVWTRRILLTTLAILTPLLVAEIMLRLLGFSRPQVDAGMQAKTIRACVEALNQRFMTDAFQEDTHLLWKLKPGSNLGGLDVSKSGTLGMELNPSVVPAHRVYRVLCLGDSVTAATYRTWPSTAHRLASSIKLTRDLEIRNAAVPGYSTEQALRWLERLQGWRPDVVALCFGWNDQFTALNIPDAELGYSNAASAVLHRMFGRLRLYQLIAAPVEAKMLQSRRQSRNLARAANDATTGTQRRVSPEQFEENVRALVEQVRSAEALPVLMTQPENLTQASERNLAAFNFITPDVGAAVELHRTYNAIVRRLATETHTPLIDLEEEFLRRKRENFFEPDGMHLTGRGHNHVARLLLALLRDEGRITAAEFDGIARAEKHDTSAPDKPRAAWSVVPLHLEAFTTETLSVGVIAQNVGNTRWLRDHRIPKFGRRSDVGYGSVYVTGTWRTINAPSRGIATEANVPSDILPGETTSVTLTLAAPPQPGSYEMEIGLRAENIGDLKQFGAETTTFTVTTR